MERDLVETGKKLLRTASDPISAVIRFLHERPDNSPMPGCLVKRVLEQVFEHSDQVPSLVRILSGHVKEVIRQSDVINIINEHPAVERWGHYIIKKKERVRFEIVRERGKVALKNIVGLVAVEYGIECVLEKIIVNPPNLEVTFALGIFKPQRTVDLM